MHKERCHAEPVEASWVKAMPHALRQAQGDSPLKFSRYRSK
jgi:hypothetical protein